MNYRGIEVRTIGPTEWQAGFAENAYAAVFGMKRHALKDRVDYSLLLAKDGKLGAFITCREHDAETIYWQYGGVLNQHIGSPLVRVGMEAALEYCKEHYKRVTFLVENKNTRMLKLAMSCGFLITGVKTVNGNILLEHMKEF